MFLGEKFAALIFVNDNKVTVERKYASMHITIWQMENMISASK